MIGEAGEPPGGFMDETQIRLAHVLEITAGVAGGLLLHLGDTVALLFPLGLDDTRGQAADHQEVVHRPGVGGIFTHGHALCGRWIKPVQPLHSPASRFQLPVDAVTGKLFRVLIGHRWLHA